jgi:hypothetical protein
MQGQEAKLREGKKIICIVDHFARYLVKWRIEVKMGRHLAEKVLWMMYMTVF